MYGVELEEAVVGLSREVDRLAVLCRRLTEYQASLTRVCQHWVSGVTRPDVRFDMDAR